MLPLSLVPVGDLGIASQAASDSPESVGNAIDFAGLVSSSAAKAAASPARWYALLIGIPLVLWEKRVLLRALISVHRTIWATSTCGRRVRPWPRRSASS